MKARPINYKIIIKSNKSLLHFCGAKFKFFLGKSKHVNICKVIVPTTSLWKDKI